jgi:endonuclease YncB( thermonuclease family)
MINRLKPNKIIPILVLVMGLLGFYFSPYGPKTSTEARPVESEISTNFNGVYWATVTRISDGDTLTVKDSLGINQKIRLHAVDAPELNQRSGEESKSWLTQQLLNQRVKILVNNTDRYKRQVAKVVLPTESCKQRLCKDETDINLKAIETGHAWWYREFSRSQNSEDQELYETAEKTAKKQGLGLWKHSEPQAPWQWRSEQRKQLNQK